MKKLSFGIFLLLGVLGGCSLLSSQNPDAQILPTSGEVLSGATLTGDEEELLFGFEILDYLKNEDMTALSLVVSASGLVVSPYDNVTITPDTVLMSDELTSLFVTGATRNRGFYDGSGEPISLSFSGYFAKFIYDVDFSSGALVSVNTPVQRGNIITNVFDLFSGYTVIEYYFSGFDPQYEGMDWKGLFLIIENIDGELFLRGLVHEQRTI